MKTVLTGLKPTGELTLGNYIGAIVPLLKMQEEYDNIYLFVADLHALTIPQDAKLLNERIRSFIAMYLACGVNPDKVTIYLQSENEYIPCISWILECNTPFGEASRMIQFKEKSRENENFSVGLLTYPILMAADILYCDADYVPVGIDQTQHVEMARNIAERFNKRYGETFKVPSPLITKVGTKIKDLKDPTKKMSKSADSPMGVISLFDTEELINKKIMSATTDSDTKVIYDEDNKPGITNLLNIASIMSGKNIETLEKEFKDKNYKEFKEYVAISTSLKLKEIQNKYEKIINSSEIENILNKGILKSREMARNKYLDMCQKIGLSRYKIDF